jgi:hypothetical protein
MRISCFLLLVFLGSLHDTYAQEKSVKLTFLDLLTGQPIYNANVKLNNRIYLPSEKGVLFLNLEVLGKELEVSCVGYKTKRVLVDKQEITILLEALVIELAEVKIANRAIEIIHDVIKNKPLNTPFSVPFFASSYTKVLLNANFASKNDSLKHREKTGVKNDYISEMVSELSYSKSSGLKEKIIEGKSAGFDKTLFAVPVTAIQPFGFYDDQIQIVDFKYISPISKGGVQKYRYILEQTVIQDFDTTYVIHFVPKQGAFFDSMEGIVFIDSKTKAIKEVLAKPSEPSKLSPKIHQRYSKATGKWFPEFQSFSMLFFKSEESGLDFTFEMYIKQDKSTSLGSFRNDYFTKEDSLTYNVIDSLVINRNVRRVFDWGEKLTEGYLPLKIVDLNLSKLANFNLYEKFRLGVGFRTNEKLSQKLSFNGYVGYGFNDKKTKYGVGASFRPSKDYTMEVGYVDDIREIGTPQTTKFSSRAWLGRYYDNFSGVNLSITSKAGRNLTVKGLIESYTVTPQYSYSFEGESTYKSTEIGLALNYSFREESEVIFFGKRVKIDTGKPSFQFSYRRGLQGLLNSDFLYNKIQISFSQTFYTTSVGTTSYKFEGGIVDKPLPAGLLFTGFGSKAKNYPVFITGFFQTMNPNDFFSDRYANVFLSHNFHNKILRIKRFAPDMSIHHNMGIGGFKHKATHEGLSVLSNSKPYFESGVVLNRVLKIDYLNTMYLGLGVGVFYKYGYYASGAFANNLTPQLSLSFSSR